MTTEKALRELYSIPEEHRENFGMKLPEWGGCWFITKDNDINVLTKKGQITRTPFFSVYGARIDWSIVNRNILPGQINLLINEGRNEQKLNVGEISDGYHTFDELYDHRIMLFLALCNMMDERSIENSEDRPAWYSKYHSDGTRIDGWFIVGLFYEKGNQITYHIPESYEKHLLNLRCLDRAPEWDEHSSEDVLERLKGLTE